MRSPRYFLVLSIAAILGIVGYRYDQYLVEKQYTLRVDVSCDSAAESCFAADCTPDSGPDCDPTPYKKVEIRAADAPACLEEHSCEHFSCAGIASCTLSLCSGDVLEDGEKCATPDTDSDSAADTPPDQVSAPASEMERSSAIPTASTSAPR
ncbi:MAG: hypothetical protein V4480_02855 [Patescibacteria group bacterium]